MLIKKVLLALDGSQYTGSVTSYGLWLAKGFGARPTGVYVVDMVALEGPFLHDLSGSLGFEPFLNFSSKMREALEDNGRGVLESFAGECAEASVECDTELGFGIVSTEICEKARLADLVVLGRRGVNAQFEYGLLGSTTESVIRRSPKPVFIVPDSFSMPESPLLCYDSSPNASKAMHSAAEFSKTFGLPLTVLTVSRLAEEAEKSLKEAEDYLKPYGVEAAYVRVDDDPASGIEGCLTEKGHDLVFMGATHHSRVVEMVLGSTTEHVMRSVGAPFFLER